MIKPHNSTSIAVPKGSRDMTATIIYALLWPGHTMTGREAPMLEHDYILEIISQFCEAVTRSLKHAIEHHDQESCTEVEREVAELIELDPATAMQLSPDSLVTMMLLSGMGESLADYVAFSLARLATVYDEMGQGDTAAIRRDQARAVAQSFNADLSQPPAELADLS